jgi:hypothetical protein
MPHMTFNDHEQELRSTLSPEQWALVRREVDDERATWLAERDCLVDQLARHLPGMGPGIRGLSDHIIDTDCEGGCCGLGRTAE